MRIYRCIELEAPTTRFTLGKEYPAAQQAGKLDVIIGDNNAEHHISPELPQFIIKNEPEPGTNHPSVPKYARFAVIDRQQ